MVKEHEDPCESEVKKFIEKHQEFINNNIVSSFLKEKENYHLFVQTICYPTHLNVKKLDEKFRAYYFKIRLTTFLSNTLHFNAINYDKKYKNFKMRNQLILDSPLSDDSEYTLKDLIEDKQQDYKLDEELLEGKDYSIENLVVDEKLYEAIQSLTDNQKQILNLAYVHELTDTEIAKVLDKSQQAVSKSHKKALEQLKNSLDKQ
ncbi:sigma-70 family RNA polymerase sigma factor [Sediminibacillus albus]|uniref:RNA polymerase sigma factor, sigma-70 family n=1 Tax=Sediminibacillus albus TaxID=407036 RepID=A0A1G9AKT1_9BACI|nr:sigma-70 family RNA polymerase sigma factor [Sediminibacillus albus]SDK27976.1 RNA polymerase sigma factor, sigma-70 family [Sediminibacillus albus]